ncbi:MAG: CoA transferase [Chloroflexi bacterium]|nr:CoA transferase [Chloroflexota bacterium]
MPSDLPLPLDGVRVTDFSWIVAGPQATRILADLGADVVKVENESYLDSMRIGLRQDPENPSLNRSGFHSNLSRNKRSITANLFHPKGREAVERLLAVSDVVIENYSAGAFGRMGFSWERLQEINPSLIYVSVSGFGHVGRDASYGTWGPSAQAVSGATAMSGLPDQPPAGWGFSYLDHSAGYYASIAVLMALHHRARTGEAQHVDMSQIETGMAVSAVPMLDYQVNGRSYERIGNRSRYPAVAPHNTYPCAGDDRWIAIAVDDEAQWASLCGVLGLDALCDDPRFADMASRKDHEDELDEVIGAVTLERDPFDLMIALQEVGVPAGVCQRTDDKQERDPQLAERGFYPTAPHEELGEHRFEGLPMQFSNARWRLDRGAPLFGEHNHAVMTELLGYDEEEFASMVSELAI